MAHACPGERFGNRARAGQGIVNRRWLEWRRALLLYHCAQFGACSRDRRSKLSSKLFAVDPLDAGELRPGARTSENPGHQQLADNRWPADSPPFEEVGWAHFAQLAHWL